MTAPALRILIFVGLATLGCAAAIAQEPAELLASVMERYAVLRNDTDIRGVRAAGRVLEELEGLVDAPAETREEACRFLKKILLRGGEDGEVFRQKVSAAGLIGALGEDPGWAKTLLGAGKRSEGGCLAWFVEPALGRLRTPAHTMWLLRQLEEPVRETLRLALGGLFRLQHEELLVLVEARRARIVELADHRDLEIRWRALRLLGRIPAAACLPPVVAAAGDAKPRLRLAAARALAGLMAYPEASAALARLLVDPLALVREEAVIAFRGAGGDAPLAVLIARLEKEPLRIRLELAATLADLTGKDLGPDAERWRAWLATSGDASKLEPATTLRQGYSAAPRWYGIPVMSDRLLFVLDVSGSMAYSMGTSSKDPVRLDDAKRELIAVLGALDERSRFNILLFADKVVPWRRGGLVEATPRNLAAAEAFVRAQEARGGTNSHGALQAAFEGYPQVDTVLFLSDGIPTVGRTLQPEHILFDVVRWNALRGLRIHAVALLAGEHLNPFLRNREDKEEAARFMQLLAAHNGGHFVRPE